jgi:hypothetical protein
VASDLIIRLFDRWGLWGHPQTFASIIAQAEHLGTSFACRAVSSPTRELETMSLDCSAAAKKVLTKYDPSGKLKGLWAIHGCQVRFKGSGSAFLLVV